MGPARLLICQRSGELSYALAALAERAGVPIVASRSVRECATALEAAPASFVVAEVREAALGDTLDFLEHVSRRFPDARVMLVLARPLERFEWLLREQEQRTLSGRSGKSQRHTTSWRGILRAYLERPAT